MTENRPNKGRDNCLKSWRIMVRNLPFDTKSNELREAYGKYGELLEINLPKCRDKKFPNSCAGFCFLQFAKRKNAEFAFVAINKAPFKGRSVSAQWAIDKDTFVTQKSAGKERQIIEQKLKKILYGDESKRPNTRRDKKSTRHNENGAVKNEIKEEVSSADENNEAEESFLSARSNATTKTETDDEDFEDENESENEEEEVGDEDEENKSLLKSELEFDDEDENEDSLNSLSDEEIHDDDEDNRKTPKVKGKKMNKSTDIANSQRKEDVAVAEGRVVFLKNVDFNATSELLKEVASKFGEVALAIQCKYPGTDQPTGSAFIHFCEKSAADAFLNELPKV